MSSIHAPIPKDLRDAVMDAKRRGDEMDNTIQEDQHRIFSGPKKQLTTSSVIMKRPVQQPADDSRRIDELNIRMKQNSQGKSTTSSQRETDDMPDDEENAENNSKENNPSLSPSPVIPPALVPRKSVLGKRPLSVLASPEEPEMMLVDDIDTDTDIDSDNGMTASEKNIAANKTTSTENTRHPPTQQRKSPKLIEPSRGVNAPNLIRNDNINNLGESSASENSNLQEHTITPSTAKSTTTSGKENTQSPPFSHTVDALTTTSKQRLPPAQIDNAASRPSSSNASESSLATLSRTKAVLPLRKFSAPVRSKPRVGVRRL